MITKTSNKGFTIVELMIAMTISIAVISAIYMVYQSQNKSYITQEQVTAMQQSLRAGAYVMSNEIRMAGCDPSGGRRFTISAAGDGTPLNPLQFSCIDSDGLDNDGDGIIDNEIKTVDYVLFDDQGDGDFELGRQENGAGYFSVAENIQALCFAYSYDSDDLDDEVDTYTDATGVERVIWAVPSGGKWFNLDSNNDGVIDDNDSPNPGIRAAANLMGTGTGVDVDLNRIGGVMIWMLAVSDRGDDNYFNNQIYIVGDQKIVGNDNRRRRLLVTTIKCRNMGL